MSWILGVGKASAEEARRVRDEVLEYMGKDETRSMSFEGKDSVETEGNETVHVLRKCNR